MYIKLGLMKQFVKALDYDINYFRMFLALSFERIKAGEFDCLHIRRLLQNEYFSEIISAVEKEM